MRQIITSNEYKTRSNQEQRFVISFEMYVIRAFLYMLHVQTEFSHMLYFVQNKSFAQEKG